MVCHPLDFTIRKIIGLKIYLKKHIKPLSNFKVTETIIQKADKGNSIVVIDPLSYVNGMGKLLNDHS